MVPYFFPSLEPGVEMVWKSSSRMLHQSGILDASA